MSCASPTRADVSAQTIKRFEAGNEIPPNRSSTMLDVQAALEAAGIEFIGSPTGPARHSPCVDLDQFGGIARLMRNMHA